MSAVLVDITSRIETMLADLTRITLPSARYRGDPVAFFREIIGIEPWSRQIELLENLRDHNRVSVKSGRRVSKSNSAGGAALWWYCSYPDARVILTAPTARQVDGILWREVDILRKRSGLCVECQALEEAGRSVPRPCAHSARVGGAMGQRAYTGLKNPGIDHREIRGFTARDGEAFQGYAGPHMLFIADEASGVDDAIFDVIKGNLAGGGKLLLTGNPTRNRGEFFDSFHRFKRDMNDPDGVGYVTMTISSEESPNVITGQNIVPGLATREYIREREHEWGRDSAMFKIHVLGEFALNEEGRIFSIDAIASANMRWLRRAEELREMGATDRAREVRALGELCVGLDPAGATGTGDDSVFCVRRGPHAIEFVHRRGLNDEMHLIQLLGLLEQHADGRELPTVILDASGSIGASLGGLLRSHLERNPRAFRLVAVRSSDRAFRKPFVYDRLRDELTASLERWIREGGEIPEDDKLAAELNTMEWEQQVNGRLKVTAKKAIKRELGRSPDRYDALALACFDDGATADHQRDLAQSAPAEPPPPDRAFDHMAGLKAFR